MVDRNTRPSSINEGVSINEESATGVTSDSPREPRGNGEHVHESAPLLGPMRLLDPLNHRYVQIYRAFMVGMFVAILIWVVLLVIDSLISIGIPNTFGSGFEMVFISLLGLLNISISLLFFEAPSASNRILELIVVALLVFNMVVIISVSQLRHRVGAWPTIISCGGTAFIFSVGAFAETIVNWGFKAEEERLDIHRRRTAMEWMELILSTAARIALLLVMAVFTANMIIDGVDSHLAPLGKLVPVGGTPDGGANAAMIHISCTPAGTKGPLILIEAGETSGEEIASWVLRAQGVSAVCYWDRPGTGFSDNCPSPVGIDAVLSYLEAAIEAERPEWRNDSLILLSHGVGSLYSRVFANRHVDRVAGLVLIDGLHEELFFEKETAMRGLRHWLQGVVAPMSFTKLKGLITGQGTSEDRVYGLLEYAQARWHKALLQQQVSASRRSRLDIELASAALPADVPLLVLSSAEMCKDRTWARYQRLLLKITDNAIAWKILDGPHELWRNARSAKEMIQHLNAFIQYLPDMQAALRGAVSN